MSEEIEQIKKKVAPILSKYGVKSASVFGSVARGEATAKSDVDILVEISRPYGLFEFIGMRHNLEDVLEKKVDLVELSSIKSIIKESILKDRVAIL